MDQLLVPARSLQVFWIGLKHRSMRGSDVIMTFVYMFQDGRSTKSLCKYVPVTGNGCTWIHTELQKTASIFTPDFSDFQ